MRQIKFAYSHGMSEEDTVDKVKSAKTGVLALSKENDAYAVPLAHHFDGDRLFFRIGVTEQSKLWKYVQSTKSACYVLYGTTETDAPHELDSWSILITGHLSEIPRDQYERFDSAEINRKFSPIRVFDEDINDIEIVIMELQIDSITGRRTVPE